MMESAQSHAVTSRDLWTTLNTLIGKRGDNIVSDATNTQLPSLWRQLTDTVQSGRGAPSRSSQESKPPLDLAALNLMILIADQIGLACHTMRIPRTFDAPEDLRQVIRHITEGGGDPDTLRQWDRALTSWAQRIRVITMNDPDRPTRLHGASCKNCGAITVHERDPDGATLNQPALMVTWQDGLVRAVECRSCGTAWFRGSGMLTMRHTDNGH
jgi:hypothetical protein